MDDGRFGHTTYLIRRKVFKLFGGAFHIFDASGSPVFYSKQAAFKLREDIRLFTGEDMSTEILTIRARKIVDFSAAYDVIDSRSGQKVGALKRKGWKSILQDHWIIMDPNDREIGFVEEDSKLLAILRRFVNLIPQKYYAELGGTEVCTYRQKFNPFVLKLVVDFSPDTEGRLDRRLGLAAAILLSAIEGRQR